MNEEVVVVFAIVVVPFAVGWLVGAAAMVVKMKRGADKYLTDEESLVLYQLSQRALTGRKWRD